MLSFDWKAERMKDRTRAKAWITICKALLRDTSQDNRNFTRQQELHKTTGTTTRMKRRQRKWSKFTTWSNHSVWVRLRYLFFLARRTGSQIRKRTVFPSKGYKKNSCLNYNRESGILLLMIEFTIFFERHEKMKSTPGLYVQVSLTQNVYQQTLSRDWTSSSTSLYSVITWKIEWPRKWYFEVVMTCIFL